jgi:hypothetical protein
VTKTTKPQRRAIKQVFDRGPVRPYLTPEEQAAGIVAVPLTYKQFRRSAQPTFGCDGAVVLPWAGMFLCIERDGYTHS